MKTKTKKSSCIEYILLIIIIAVAFFLRFWRIGTSTQFFGDFGWYYLQARDLLTGSKFPLVGISSSVPVLHQGVLWTYLLATAIYFGNFNPVSGAILSGVLGIAGVVALYFISKNIFNKRVALIASSVAASLPFIVLMDRMPFQTSAIFPLTCLFTWLVCKVQQRENEITFFMLGLTFGLLFQFELAAIILLPVIIIVYFIKEVSFSIKNIAYIAAGMYLGTITFWLHDFKMGVYLQTVGFAAWFFTKIADSLVILIPLILIFIWVFIKFGQKLKKVSFPVVLIFVWGFLGLAAFWIRGIVSDAYLPLIYVPLILLFSLGLDLVFNKYLIGTLILISMFFICNVNSVLVKINSTEYENIGLNKQSEVSRFIAGDAGKMPFKFLYAGLSNQFTTSKDNWEYLLWYEGATVQAEAKTTYLIVRPPFKILQGFEEIADFGYIKVGKKI